ncbi:hypothetical protein LJC71_04855 [Desulfosarcina sp. OttesenSCG-928-A07]|nr:hypothetical protein [Desulfosarcina sp. OttesenSCG-928-G17]MDL2329067.1 hypothetical protein [Desulfosarcina sp. OttesenSCG-928-A07]
MEWFRWYHGAVSDDKWPLISRRSGQSIAVVIAVWASLLECASQADERGSIKDVDPESIDAHLQIDDGATQSVIDALSSGNRPRIVDGKILNWSKRQPLKEDGTSAERVRKHRERQKTEQNQHDVTPCNAYVTPCNAYVTPCNADVTPCNDRTEQIRTEKNRTEQRLTPLTPHPVGDANGEQNSHATKKQKPQSETDFDAFWDAYPRKTGKAAAEKAWKKARDKPDLNTILGAIESQKTWDQWRRDGGQYIPNPATWLNQGRWDDKPPDVVQSRDGPTTWKSPAQRRLESNMAAAEAFVNGDFGTFGSAT